MSTESSDDNIVDESDFDDGRDKTKWAVLVDLKSGGWIITQIHPDSEVGEYETDLCNDFQDYKIGAFFDSNVEEILDAITKIGGGGLETNIQIEGLLSGTCRSLLEAMGNLTKWQVKSGTD